MALNGQDGAKIRDAIAQFGKNIKSEIIKTAPFDKNVNGRIVDINGDGYTVEIQTRKYPNLKAINAQELKVNDIVACCIPNNQMSQAYILGKLVGNISVSASGGISDSQINGISIVSNGVANFVTKTAYDATKNKIVTESDLPTVNDGTLTIKKNNSTEATFTANQSGNTDVNFATVAFSGSYADLSNTPTIPTVNNGQLTVSENGQQLGTFTANQSGNTTVDIPIYNSRNLAINSNFKINQRRQSSYTSGETVDLWTFGHDGTKTLSVLNDGVRITISTQGTYTNFQQNKSNITAGTYTLTVYTSDTLKFNNPFMNVGGNWQTVTLVSSTSTKAIYRIVASASGSGYFGVQVKETAGSVDIYKIQLEYGEISTEYVEPDPALELVRCQRYFYRFWNGIGTGHIISSSNKTAVIRACLPVPMKGTPTYNLIVSGTGGGFYVRYAGQQTTVSAISSLSYAEDNTQIELALSLTDSLTSGGAIDGWLYLACLDITTTAGIGE